MAEEHSGCDMQEWMEKNKKNDHHAHLQKSVGDWKVLGKFWMAPGQEPMQTEGKSSIVSVLDGRFVQHQYDSDFGGQPFSGIGIDGYDNHKEKYVSFWTDSMSTGFCIMEGSREGNVTTCFGEMPGAGGKMRTVKSVTEYHDDKMVFSMFDKNGDDWHKNMELEYVRA